MTSEPEDTAESPPSDSRALAPDNGRVADRVAERVAHVRQLMAVGAYRTGITPYQLADAWGCSPSTVFNYSAEASRQIRAGMGDGEQVRTTVLGWLEQAADMARTEGGARGAQALTGAAKELAAIAGVTAPTKVELTGLGDMLALAFGNPAAHDDDED